MPDSTQSLPFELYEAIGTAYNAGIASLEACVARADRSEFQLEMLLKHNQEK